MKSINQKDWQNKIRKARDYREWVGPSDEFDLNASIQFNLSTSMGLRENHKFLEIGCGSLRAGRLFINFLNPNSYFGIEPEQWLIEEAQEKELGREIFKIKNPNISNTTEFDCQSFDLEFDFVMCQGVFTHAAEKQIRKCIKNVSECLKPKGVFLASYFQGDSNYAGNEWLYPLTSQYTKSRFEDMVNDSDLSCIHINVPHPRKAQWVIIFHPNYHVDVIKKINNIPKISIVDQTFIKRLKNKIIRIIN